MTEEAGPDQPPSVEAYLLECLRALREGRSVPERPSSLDRYSERLDRKVRRLGEMVRDQGRARRQSRMARASLDDPDAIPIPGYSLLDVVGRGRFGVVFRAEDHRWRGRLVAVKVLLGIIPDSPLDDELWDRVFGEARRSAILDHPNIVRCYDHGLVTLGPDRRRAFLVFELVDGATLHEQARSWSDGPGPPPARPGTAWRERQGRVASLLIRVARAAHAVHVGKPKQGLAGGIHGDITPKNILIDAAGEPRLTDFGLAIGRDALGARGGTSGFMAPEVGRPGEPIGPEADVYSIGATLHHCLIGPPPEAAAGASGLSPPCPRLHPDLDAIRRKALHPDPSLRYRRASDLADDLRRFVAGETVEARPVPAHTKAIRSCRRHPWRTAVGVAAIAGAALLGWSSIESHWRGRTIERLNQALDVSLPIVEMADPEATSGGGDLPIEARRLVASRLLPYLDHVASARGDDPRANATLASALVARARLRHVLGKPEDDDAAIVDLERAGAIFRALPDGPDREIARAGAAVTLASILGPRRDFGRALAAVDPVVAMLVRVVGRSPSPPYARYRLALALNSRATSRRGLALDALHGKAIGLPDALAMMDVSVADYTRALDLLRGLQRTDPDDPRFPEWISRMQGNLGLLLLDQAVVRKEAGPAALVALRDAVGQAEILAARMPHAYRAQDALVAARVNLGDGLRSIDQPAQAEAVYRRAVADYDELNDRLPQFREFAWGRATARRQLGLALADQGRVAEARTAFEEALAFYDRLVKTYKDVREIAAERDDVAKRLARRT